MNGEDFNEFLCQLEKFKVSCLAKSSRAFEIDTSVAPQVMIKAKELGFDELFKGLFCKNEFLTSKQFALVMRLIGEGDPGLGFMVVLPALRSSLEERAKVLLPDYPIVPFNNYSFVAGEINDKSCAYFVNRNEGGLEVTLSSFSSFDEIRYMGLRGVPFKRLNKVTKIEAITSIPKEEYLGFLTDISMLYQAVTLGLFKASINYAHEYAKERIAFGRPIMQFQAISQKLAGMAINYEKANDCFEAALVNEKKCFDIAMVKQSQDCIVSVIDEILEDSVQILGGHGYLEDHPVEKWMRDSQVLKMLICELGRTMEYEQ